MSRSQVFSQYRKIFRARKSLFAGDGQAMQASRLEIKNQFLNNRTAAPEMVPMLLDMVDEAVDMMTNGIVRGDLNQNTGHYEVKIKPEHANANVEPITEQTVSKLQKPMVERNSKK